LKTGDLRHDEVGELAEAILALVGDDADMDARNSQGRGLKN
jgi:hypothetical protein